MTRRRSCSGDCLANWGADGSSGQRADVAGAGGHWARSRGMMAPSVTFNDMPLYYWINDMGPGDAGQNVNSVVRRPTADRGVGSNDSGAFLGGWRGAVSLPTTRRA